MNIRAGLTALGVGMAALGQLALPPAAQANGSLFGAQNLNPGDVVAIAVPFSSGAAYNLLIVEQLSNSRACWREQGGTPTTIDPLLLQFDFTGVCGRSTDSNGYSLRLGEQDLGWRYNLRLVQERGMLVLKAFDVENPSRSPIEVGNTGGLGEGMLKINLNPGWRMAKRTYEGRTLGHVYLVNDQGVDQLIAATPQTAAPQSSPPPTPIATAAAAPTPITISTPAQTPSTTPDVTVRTTEPLFPGTGPVQIFVPPYEESQGGSSETLVAAVPVSPAPAAPTTITSTPAPVVISGNVLPVPRTSIPTLSSSNTGMIRLEEPTGQVPPPPNSTSLAQSLGLRYRVVVDAQTPDQQNRLKGIIPDAFNIRVGDRRMMQAGAFAEEFEAQELQARLNQVGLAAQIVPVQ